MSRSYSPKRLVIHQLGKDLLIAVHALDEVIHERLVEYDLEVIEGVHATCGLNI